MYYVSSIANNKYGVTDTKDNVTEYYTYDQVCHFVDELGLFIQGVNTSDYPLAISVAKPAVSFISDLARSFTILDKSQLGMGDHHSDIVENLCCMTDTVDNDVCYYELDEDALDYLSNQAYQILIDKRDPYLREVISYLVNDEYENYETVKSAMYAEGVSSVSKSEIYKATYTVYKFIQEYDKKLAKHIKEKLLDDMKQNGVASIKVGYEVGHEYFRYLDSKIFGTITNCFFTVGHAITGSDKQEFKELKPYSYMHCKDYNGLDPRPEIFMAFLYRNDTDKNYVIVDVKLGRKGYVGKSVISTVGYIKDVCSFKLRVGDINNAKIVADRCNSIAVKAREFAMKYESLLHLLPQGNPVEKF